MTIAALAAPTPTRTVNKRSFKVPQRRSLGHPRDPSAAMAKAYSKFGWNMTSIDYNQNSAANPSATSKPTTTTQAAEHGEVTATPDDHDSQFLSPVTIGGQTLNLDFDTGSSDLWVFSTELSKAAVGGHTAFDSSKSGTFQLLEGEEFYISYGDQSGAAGIVGIDVVDIGGATVTSQAIELATAISSSFARNVANDGLVGLGFSSINTVTPHPQKTFFDNIAPHLAQPVFTADLHNDTHGTYEFGAVDARKHAGALAYTPVDPRNGFWQFASATFAVDGKMSTRNAADASPAIADTGTSLMLVDDAVARAYYAAVDGAAADVAAGGFVYPCSATLPAFAVAIGEGYMATVPGDRITYAQVDDRNCFGGIQSNGGAGLQIYGDVLFRSQFVVFDGGEMRIGMAPKAL
ncbi:hypothetical protein LTR28_009221 [Elasticomyces elasticus]|nr:hypothetical protein LTR28_009221 [Elasticomyces elasticus]